MMRVAVFIIFAALAAPVVQAETIRVGAAISLKEALTGVQEIYEKQTGDKVEFTFGSSGQVMGQIKNGAAIDVFISAADKQVDDLVKAELVLESSRRVVAGNAVVLIVPSGSKESPRSFAALADAKWKKVAIGEPKTVPAGQYAEQVLKSAKVLDALGDRLIYGSSVRQVLDYVTRGEMAAGVVYATDAKQAGEKVKVVATADASTHDPVVYPAVIVKRSAKREASAKFLEFLAGEKARAALTEKGFTAPEKDAGAMTHFWGPLFLSLRIAGAATLLAGVVAVPTAYVLARRRFFGRSLVEALFTIPLVLPPTVVGYFLIVAMGREGWVGRLLARWFDYSIMFRTEGAVLAAALVALPMLYMPAKAAFAAVDHDLEDAAKLSGAGPLQTFWHVSLPLARRGLASGVLLAFARALGEFGATMMVFGMQARRMTLPISIYLDYEQGELGHASAAVAALTGISLSLILLYNRSSLGVQDR